MKRTKGFTLAELLIVVAIIAVLVAISIPILSSQLEKSRRAVDLSNARNICSALTNAMNSGTICFNNKDATLVVFVTTGNVNGGILDEKNPDDVVINGKAYRTVGYKALWEVIKSFGISDSLKIKQKSSSVQSQCHLLREISYLKEVSLFLTSNVYVTSKSYW